MWSRIQGNSGHSVNGPLSIPLSSPTPAGNLIIATLSDYNVAVGNIVIQDDLGHNFTPIVRLMINQTGSEIWSFVAPLSRTYSIVFSSFNYSYCVVDEFSYSGVVAADGNASNSGTSTSASSGNVAVGGDDLVYASVAVRDSEGAHTFASGYTPGFSAVSSSGVYVGIATEYLLDTMTNPATPTFSFANVPSAGWTMTAASFKTLGGIITGAPLIPHL